MGFFVLLIYYYTRREGNIINDIKRIDKKGHLLLFVLGFVNMFLSMSFLQLSVKEGSAAGAAVIFCVNPVFVVMLSSFVGIEIMNRRKILAILLSIVGIFFIYLSKNNNWDKVGLAIFYAVISAFLFAIYVVLSKKIVCNISVSLTNIVSFFWGIFFMLIYIAFFVQVDKSIFHLDNILRIAYLGFIVTGIGYITFMKTIKLYTPSFTSVIFLLKPVVATVFSIILLREFPSIYFYVGLITIFLSSSLLVNMNKLRFYK